MAGFGISGVESLDSTCRELVAGSSTLSIDIMKFWW